MKFFKYLLYVLYCAIFVIVSNRYFNAGLDFYDMLAVMALYEAIDHQHN